MKINYIIPAGGIGNRFGSEIPKQFIKLGAIPIIIRTLKLLRDHPKTNRIIVPMNSSWHDHFEKLLIQWDMEGIEVTNGGDSRHKSILNAIEILGEGIDYIAIHDAVRPLFTYNLIDRLIENLEFADSSIPVIPVVDTIKLVDTEKGVILETVDRSYLRAAQTPQMFKKQNYIKALSSLQYVQPTDDASVLEAAGTNPSYVLGEEGNIKITTPYDLKLAELILAEQRKQEPTLL